MKNWKKLAENIWENTDEIRMPGGIYFSIRSTAVKLESGGIWLHSPCNFDEQAIDELKSIGEVRFIVAPNTYHHSYIAKAALAFPNADIWCASGVEKKQKELKIDGVLDRKMPWSDEIESLPLKGAPALNESVFFHHKSRSFICTDFVFNIHTFQNLRTKFLMTLVGANQKFAQSRSWRLITKDKPALARNVDEILGWDCSRVVMAHGKVLEASDLREQIRATTSWLPQNRLLEKSPA